MSIAARDIPKPRYVLFDASRAPADLRQLPWVVWGFEWDTERNEGQGGWAKPPFSPRASRQASVTNPLSWGSYEDALHRYLHKNDGTIDGLGVIILRENGVVAIDLDDCRDPRTGKIAEWALQIVRSLHSYTSISPSGTGLHIYIHAAMVRDGRRKDWVEGGRRYTIEVYADKHYVTETGHHLPGTPTTIEPAQTALVDLLAEHFDDQDAPPSAPVAPNEPGRQLPTMADEVVIAKMLGSKRGERIKRLFVDGDCSMQHNDESRADLGLCWEIAFYTRDAEQIDRIFRQSALFREEKWGQRADYRQRTITKALSAQTGAYTAKKPGRRQGPRLHLVAPITSDAQPSDAWADSLPLRVRDMRAIYNDGRIPRQDRTACLVVWEFIDSYPSDSNLDTQPYKLVDVKNLAERLGTNDDQTRLVLKGLEEQGLIVRDPRRGTGRGMRWYIRAGALPDAALTKEGLKVEHREHDKHRHQMRCPACKSSKVHPHTCVCEGCGAVHSIADVVREAADHNLSTGSQTESGDTEERPLPSSVDSSELNVHGGATVVSVAAPPDHPPVYTSVHDGDDCVVEIETRTPTPPVHVDSEPEPKVRTPQHQQVDEPSLLASVQLTGHEAGPAVGTTEEVASSESGDDEPCAVPEDEARRMFREFRENGAVFVVCTEGGPWQVSYQRTAWRPSPELWERFKHVSDDVIDLCAQDYGAGCPRRYSTRVELQKMETEAAERRAQWTVSRAGGGAA